jgi:SAM-dependent methyltransferase
MTIAAIEDAPALRPVKPDQGLRFREYLQNAGYTIDKLSSELQLSERPSVRVGNLKYLLARIQETTELNLLACLFILGVPVPSNTARQLIPAWVIELALQSGMLVESGAQLHPKVMLSQIQTIIVASDRFLKYEENPEDLVIWPNPSSYQLNNAMIRKPFGSALDIGCGSGMLALTLAQHCKTVTATDVNSRAAEFTVFNAALNGVENIGCLNGDCLKPVEGQTFDLIVANPPFFVTPGNRLLFCENPMELDLFCRRLAREAPACLNEGGFFQMLCEWVELKGQSWRDRITEWFEGSGCDAWVGRTSTIAPAPYCTQRINTMPLGPHDTNSPSYAEWIGHFHERGVNMIHGGVLTMRKRYGDNWIQIEEDFLTLDHLVGHSIANEFFSRDMLRKADEELLEERPKLCAGVTLNHLFRQSGASWEGAPLKLVANITTPRALELDKVIAQFVARFNGQRSLRELALDLAREVKGEPERITAECVSIMRKLLERGFLQAFAE